MTDDPLLTVRQAGGAWKRQPLRIVLDSNLRISDDRKVLDTAEAKTLVVITSRTLRRKSGRAAALAARGVEVLAVGEDGSRCDLNPLLDALGRRGIEQLLVEGGPTVLESFLRQGLVDEVRIYVAPAELASEGTAKVTKRMAEIVQNPERLFHCTTEDLDCDRCISGLLREPPEN